MTSRGWKLSIMAMILILAPLTAATISLPKEIEVEKNQFVPLKATTDGKIVKWVALDSGISLFPSELLKDSTTTVVFAQKSGRILAYTGDASGPSDPAYVTIKVKGDTPDPNPGPTPGPTPDPTPPKEGKLWILCIYDNDIANTEMMKIVGDQALWKQYQDAGHRYRLWPSKSKSIDAVNLRQTVDKTGLPCLVILGKSGKFIKAVKFPSSLEAFQNEIKGATQ